ncbi:MAG: asparagine synthase (glutamine-hydrolyzing) [candidate division Zixibacteria bacterium]|nr:asparagine synthase (glutamine-hydrolyzing) [candidate division Zixibacteria bacterium]
MCGICGIIYNDRQKTVDSHLIREMCQVLRHRGPDDQGFYLKGNVGLGHQRLSIIDLGLGHQPISNEDDTLWIIYNGEVYNYLEIRPSLEKKGYKFKTNSDTEVVLHAFEEYGVDCLKYFRGMFGFAIWDEKKKTLFLARDRMGVKPLYYSFNNDFFIFGSEIKTILQNEQMPCQLNFSSLNQFLSLKYTSDDSTLFSGIKKLLPGRYLIYQDKKISIKQYWDIDYSNSLALKDNSQYVEEFYSLFKESVKMRLRSDVPLGMFLSGGIDSSIIATSMSKMVDQPIKTFSVAFKEKAYSELEYARLVAKHIKADHHEIIVEPEQFFSHLPFLIWQEDEPIAHPSSIPLYFVSKLASQHVKVVLTGEGSDELLAGYERYYQTLYNLAYNRYFEKIVPGFVKQKIIRKLIDILPHSFPGKRYAIRSFLYLDSDLESIYWDNFSTFSKEMLRELLLPEIRERVKIDESYAPLLGYFNQSNSPDLLNKFLYVDLKSYLVELLMKQDQMSMAASIESRVPFLDHKLVEFVARIPIELKLKGFTTKRILREAAKEDLPKPILVRKKKGFPVPIAKWFKNEYYDLACQIILDDRAKKRGFFDFNYIEKLLLMHKNGERDFSDRIWTLINFELWQRIFLDKENYREISLM